MIRTLWLTLVVLAALASARGATDPLDVIRPVDVPTVGSAVRPFASVYYLRTDGDDSACNGLSDASVASAPNCAFQHFHIAWAAATFGDTIKFKSGQTFPTIAAFTPYSFTDKGVGTTPITVTSTIAPPADGTRVTLADRANMAKLEVIGGSSWFQALPNAHHVRVSGLWFTNKPFSETGLQTTLLLSNASGIDYAGTNFPNNITVDHCFFNPAEWDTSGHENLVSSVNSPTGMVGPNAVYADNYMTGFGGRYASDGATVLDANGILIGASKGPVLIDNNFIESWFVGFFVGGADPGSAFSATVASSPAPTLTSARLSNTTGLNVGDNIAFTITNPSPFTGDVSACGTILTINSGTGDVTFTHLVAPWTSDNYSEIPNGAAVPASPGFSAWNGWIPSFITVTHNYFNKPIRWFNDIGTDGKGMFEIKLCDHCVIEGNTFNGNTGWTVTVRNQGGYAPWSVIRVLSITSNLSVRFGNGLAGLFKDNQRLSKESDTIDISNNLLYNPAPPDPVFGINPYWFSTSYGIDVQVTHNTVINTGATMQSGSAPGNPGALTGFIMRDNIFQFGTYFQGYLCFNQAFGDNPYYVHCTPDMVWTKNVMIAYPNDQIALFPSGNYNPATQGAVGWTNTATGNYQLLPSSPYHNAGSDGEDIGVNCTQLSAALGFNGCDAAGDNVSLLLKGSPKLKGKVTVK